MEKRIQQYPEAFNGLSEQDRALVLSHRIREGFGPEQVYIAWGRPDSIRKSWRDGKAMETWIYTGTQTQAIPSWEAFPLGFRCGVFYEPIYRPIFVSIPYFLRAATFEKGHVVEWEDTQD